MITKSITEPLNQSINKAVGQTKLEYRGVKLWNQISEKLKSKFFNLFKKLL